MLRRLLNHAEIELQIKAVDPLLIASGVPNAYGTDMPFVLTYRNGSDRGEPYLPGSSLKGVLRSHVERISRSIAPNAGVCDPHFTDADTSARTRFCGKRLDQKTSKTGDSQNNDRKELPTYERYKKSCPICRTFGSTVYKGRLSIGDAYLENSSEFNSFTIEHRDGVGIDRFTGGASRGAKFEMEVLTDGTFCTRLRIENFENWQLGLVAIICRDLSDDLISIGHSTTRGLGRIHGELKKFDIFYVVRPNKQLDSKKVYGVGALMEEDNERKRYGYAKEDTISLGKENSAKRDGVIRLKQSFIDSMAQNALFDSAVDCWATRMENWGG